jgi:hypothetical protein
MVLFLNPFHPISIAVGIIIWVVVYLSIFKLHKYDGYAIARTGDTSSSPEASVIQKRNPPEGPDCECYVTIGPDPGYFQHFLFYDFRKQAVPESRNIRVMPPSANASGPLGLAYTSKDSILFDDHFRDHWLFSPFVHPASSKAPLTYINVVQNAFIYYNETVGPDPVLILRTTRNLDSQSVCGITSRDENIIAVTARSRTRMLPSSESGAHAGLTMFHNLDGDFSNVTKAYLDTTNLNPFTWGVHRLDYLYPNSSAWYNERPVRAFTDFRHPGRRQISLNIWSDGGLFTGNMSVGDEAYLAVEWFMIAYNNTEDHSLGRSRRPCGKTCKIDDLKVIGVPERCNVSDLKVVDIPESMIHEIDLNWPMRGPPPRLERRTPNLVPKTGARELDTESRLSRTKRGSSVKRDQSALTPPEGHEDEAPDDKAPDDDEGSGDDGAGDDSPGGDPSGGDPTDANPSDPTDEFEPPASNPPGCNSPKNSRALNSGPPLTPPKAPHSPPATPPDVPPCCPCACCPSPSRTCLTLTPPLSGMGSGPITPQDAHGSGFVVRDRSTLRGCLPNSPESSVGGANCRVCSNCTSGAGGMCGGGMSERWGVGNRGNQVTFWVMIGAIALIMGSVMVVLGCS